MNKYALFLSNDPSKGAFEAGAWQALYQMRLPIACVSGGGLNVCNAALIAQGEAQRLFDFWHRKAINGIMQLNAEMVRRYVTDWAFLPFKDFRAAFHHALFDHHTSLIALKQQLPRLIDESRIRRSKTQLCVAVPDWDTLELQPLTIEEIPSGQLIDYLLRCVALPAFCHQDDTAQILTSANSIRLRQIEWMASQQCSELISFEPHEFSFHKALKKSGVNEKIVSPSVYLEPCSKFEITAIKKQMRIGFLDCMKTFDLVHGRKYYLDFRKDLDLFKRFSEILGAPPQDKILNDRLAAWMNLPQNFSEQDGRAFIKQLIKKSSFRKEKSAALSVLEICALKLEIEKNDFYSPDVFIGLLFDKIESAFTEHLEIIRSTNILNWIADAPETSEYRTLTLPALLGLYTGILSPAIDISSVTCYKIRNHLLPEDQLALFGLIYLNLMVKTL